MTPKEVATATLTAALKDFDADKAKSLITEDYIQHNPNVPTGAAPFLGFIPSLKDSGIKTTTHRVLQDCDLIAFHNSYENAELFGGPKLVTFDILRVKDGKCVEHWDNLQPIAETTKSGRSMTDGPTEVVDLNKTEANKKLVSTFVETVLVGGKFDTITDYISTETYHQHNPLVGDGLDGVQEAFAALAEAGTPVQYKKLHLLVGEGNFVLTMSEGTFGNEPYCYQDLFRIENGLIVEHWDTMMPIPATMAHSNGMF